MREPDATFALVQRQVREELASGATPREVCFDAFVSRRRPFGNALTFLDLRSANAHDGSGDLQALLKQQAFGRAEAYAGYALVLQPGTHVRLTARAVAGRTAGEALLVISDARVLAPPALDAHVALLLKAARLGLLDEGEVAEALRVPAGAEWRAWLASAAEPLELAREWQARVASGAAAAPPAPPAHVARELGLDGSAKLRPAPRLFDAPPTRAVAAAAARPPAERDVAAALAELGALEAAAAPVRVNGWVQGRRRYQDRLTMLQLVATYAAVGGEAAEGDAPFEALAPGGAGQLRVALHPAVLRAAEESLRAYSEACAPAARVRVLGVVDGGTLWATELQLLRASWQPRALAQLLDEIAAGALDAEEAAASLLLPGGGAEAAALAALGTTDPIERQWRLRALSVSLQGAASRMGVLTAAQASHLDATAALRARWPVEAVEAPPPPPEAPPPPLAAPPASADAARGESGQRARAPPMLPRPLAPPPERRARSGPRWWESNKRPQIEVMLALVEPFVRRHAAAQAALAARRPLCVLDIGGGKGSLAAALAERFGAAVDVTVVDVAAAPLAKGAARAEQRGDGNVRFVRADASVFAVDTDGAAGGGGVDLVVALHACGALSDVALAQAVRHGCGFVICPCCFRANGQLRIPVGPADARAAQPAALAPAEWLGVSAESLGALLHAAELQGDHAVAARAAHATCALRAEAAVRRWADAHGARERGSSGRRAGADRRLAVRIVQFPIAFSTRNRCLVGMPVADDREDDTVSDWS